MIAGPYIRNAAREFNVTVDDILSDSRRRKVCMARWCVMAKLHERGWSTPRIGQAVNRHHTTVLHAMGRLSR